MASEPEIEVLADDEPAWRRLWQVVALVVILWASFVLKLQNLDHTALTHWDEVYHAVVAQNVAKHPFRPTLVDTPYLPYDHQNWNENHVWLHKPIVPFWQVALSFAVFGVNTFALRLPAAILATAAVGLTYLIGRELVGRGAALIAAALQAFNPFVLSIVHGYQFADTVDIALLFWVEVGIYCVVRAARTGTWRDVCFAGVGLGLAFLSKSYVGAIVFGVALVTCLLPPSPRLFGWRKLLAMLAVAAATVAPWLIYCAVAFPEEFWHEHAQVWRHLYTNVESWGAPWDRLVFDYMVAMYGVFYAPILVALAVLAVKTRRGDLGLILLYAWSLGVIVPHLFAATKTPSMTLTAMPAMFLLFGAFVAEAFRGVGALAALAAVLAMGMIDPAVIREPGYGYPNAAGAIMRQNFWVVEHVVVALIAGAAAGRLPRLGRLRRIAMAFCVGLIAWFVWRDAEAAWVVTIKDSDDPYCVSAGTFARNELPATAVLLCRETKPGEHLTLMFYADRTCYTIRRDEDIDAVSPRLIEAGGIPYIVSPSRLTFPVEFDGGDAGAKVYRWEP